MKATLVELSVERATIRLTPCWLARLFGARETAVELAGRYGGWYAAGSGRELERLPHYEAIRNALDFVPVSVPARAIARQR